MFALCDLGKTLSHLFQTLSPARFKSPFFLEVGFLAVLLLGFSGCAVPLVEKAFAGKLTPRKNNKIINEYCQSCHIHKDFDPGLHVFEVRKSYRRSVYKKATECRVCHFVETSWARSSLQRKTRYPYDVDRGIFREFEQNELKKMKQAKK